MNRLAGLRGVHGVEERADPMGEALHGRLHVSLFVVVMMLGELGSGRMTVVTCRQNSF